MPTMIPKHLARYCVDQDYSRYTPVDQAVWRYIVRQLRAYLSKHAHEGYLEGLEKTGISVDRIPSIEEISQKLESFGWRAVPVSGFIPPAAFMEMQAHGILPIASDMRSLEHLLYTPAPDIVHEAAGHAPFLATPEYADYLKRYAQVARKAIISREDMDQYEAIRTLSDLKESPDASTEEIRAAEDRLNQITSSMSHISEAAELSRMNWWTAEYGLIGDIENPKIYGAGLLSSVGESRQCLSSQVKKIPLSVKCVEQSYDITEPQPQLFVARDFDHLNQVLDEFADTMAFRHGGTKGLDKAIQAQSVNSFELTSGVQCSGVIDHYLTDATGEVAFVKLSGESQLCYQDKELSGHGRSYHSHGFSTPVGRLTSFPDQCPSKLSDEQWSCLGLVVGERIQLHYTSGFRVEGVFKALTRMDDVALILTLDQAHATFEDKTLFQPEWGTFDIALGERVTSVFGGPADREAFGEYEDFANKRVPQRKFTQKEMLLNNLYARVRELRENNVTGSALEEAIQHVFNELEQNFSEDWLLRLELYELSHRLGESHPITNKLLMSLEQMAHKLPDKSINIHDGLILAGNI